MIRRYACWLHRTVVLSGERIGLDAVDHGIGRIDRRVVLWATSDERGFIIQT